jgi:hypothetical protein
MAIDIACGRRSEEDRSAGNFFDGLGPASWPGSAAAAARPAAEAISASLVSVPKKPGDRAFACDAARPEFRAASARASASRPAFAAMYDEAPGDGELARRSSSRVSGVPSLRSTMPGHHQPDRAPRPPTDRCRSGVRNRRDPMTVNGRRSRSPTLWIRMSTGPAPASASLHARTVRHLEHDRIGRPYPAVRAARPRAAPASPASVPCRSTRAPASARPLAISQPRPRAEPVISAVRPSRRNLIRKGRHVSGHLGYCVTSST